MRLVRDQSDAEVIQFLMPNAFTNARKRSVEDIKRMHDPSYDVSKHQRFVFATAITRSEMDRSLGAFGAWTSQQHPQSARWGIAIDASHTKR